MKQFFKQKIEINYLYFSILFTFLITLSLIHYCTREQPLSGFSLFYGSYAVGQALFEIGLFVFLAHILKRWTPSWIYLLFISLSAIFFLLHFTHFILVRLVDAPLSFAFKLLLGTKWLAAFRALNMSGPMAALIFGSFLAIPLAGLLLHRITLFLSKHKPLRLSLFQILGTLLCVGTSLFLLDLIAHLFVPPLISTKYQKTLPLGRAFLAPSHAHLSLSTPFPPPQEEKNVILPSLEAAHKPNIYLFVIETFRKDYLEVAPHLTQFAKEHLNFDHSFANASSTQFSWFSIFQSKLPFHWTTFREKWKKGSIPLQLLKNLGYQIEVFSSAELGYFNMDELIFGHEHELLDRCTEYFSNRALTPSERDQLSLQSLEQNLAKEGHLYLIFLDSTHSEYSFPKDFAPYQPITQEIDYLTIGPKSPELEQIKNRYRNAIHYVDHLLGNFFETLKQKELYEEAIIGITGDHGEEFFEEGALFHGTHLNTYQTSVPILLKFPSKEWIPQTKEMTHVDLFPSILHYLTKKTDFHPLFDGRSVFSQERPPYRISVLQNGPHNPIEFILHQKEGSLHARFLDSSTLEIVKLEGSLELDAIKF